MANYLDNIGLTQLWSRISSLFVRKSDLGAVATSNNYNDLSNLPTIPKGVVVDSAMSSSSTNPVQNKVIYTALSGKAASSHAHSAANITSGTIAAARMPIATASALGAIQVGTGLVIDNGVLSADVEEISSQEIAEIVDAMFG